MPPPRLRVTFLCNVWLNHAPAAVVRLSDEAVSKLNAAWAETGHDTLTGLALGTGDRALAPPVVAVTESSLTAGAFVSVSMPFVEASDDSEETSVTLAVPSGEWWAEEAPASGTQSSYAFVYSAEAAGEIVSSAGLCEEAEVEEEEESS